MSKKEWAIKEIELAKKRELGAASEYEWDYKCACYDSALKAFISLIEDDHSGMSIKITKNILNRLIDGIPLVPIEDTEDIWDTTCMNQTDDYISYQCKRMRSLFKHVYKDGTIKYYDNDYCKSININNSEFAYHSSLISNMIHDIFPITMPYLPTSMPKKVYCEEFLIDLLNGNFDTVGVLYVIHPDGSKTEINRYFKVEDNGWEEIDIDEYKFRYSLRVIKNNKNTVSHHSL